MSEYAPCTECGAPLAVDQRYCLSCGARRPEARLPFVDVLAGADTQLVPLGAAGVVPLAAPAGGGTFEDRLRRAVPLLALVSVLLLALLIGLLLGHWSSDDGARAAAPAPPPQVITVAGAAAPAPGAAAAAVTTPTTETTATTPTETTPEETGTTASEAAAPKPAAKEVQDLDKLSGEEYQKKVDKLPKTFSTGGKAPPKDDKPAGGGSAVEEIG